MVSVPIALTIAGSDSSGGAGIQADLKTFSALGVYGASVITALTAQNTREVRDVRVVPSHVVAAQLEAVFDDLRVDAIKIGMVACEDTILVVSNRLRKVRLRNIVLDPVMIAKSGDSLLPPESVETLCGALIRVADLITPNIPEAAALLRTTPGEVMRDLRRACERLHELGARAVLLKGGHAAGDTVTDAFFDGSHFESLAAPRIETRNTHGTGCTLSSAIAARLAHGDALVDAVRAAKSYVTDAIRAADTLGIGGGHGPLHHFHALWPARDR